MDDKAQFADWSTRDDIKNQLNMDLTILLYQNGYPPEWDEEVFEKVMEQAENFKKYSIWYWTECHDQLGGDHSAWQDNKG